jgi:hypothetical protein
MAWYGRCSCTKVLTVNAKTFQVAGSVALLGIAWIQSSESLQRCMLVFCALHGAMCLHGRFNMGWLTSVLENATITQAERVSEFMFCLVTAGPGCLGWVVFRTARKDGLFSSSWLATSCIHMPQQSCLLCRAAV